MKKMAVIFTMLLYCFLLNGCGKDEIGYSIMSGTASETRTSVEEEAATSQPDMETLFMEAMGIEILTEEEKEERKSTRENVITLGMVGKNSYLQRSVSNFNGAQEDCWVEIQKYESKEALLLDAVRGQGPDIISVYKGLDLYSLAEKGVVEDLVPYFESSEVVKREDIVTSIWRAGSIEDKMYYVIPRFEPKIFLVEKGYTDDGVWSVDDYLALAEKYPEGKISECITASGQYSIFTLDLGMAFESYIDWEKQSCSFECAEFINLLEKLKSYIEKSYVMESASLAEQMYNKELLTKKVELCWDYRMTKYRDLKKSMLDFCEIAGVPNDSGQLMYSMVCWENYAINAASDKKELAWSFLEFLLSGEYQYKLMDNWHGGDNLFPVRYDVLESSLQAEMNRYNEEPHYYKNSFTGERVCFDPEFTEEDVQVILDIVENCYFEYTVKGDINNILVEEILYYFDGKKSVKEVVEVIQNRVSLYLME